MLELRQRATDRMRPNLWRRVVKPGGLLLMYGCGLMLAGSASASTTIVSIGEDDAFHQPNISIAPGDTVRWIADDEGHTVTADDNSFDSSGGSDPIQTIPLGGDFLHKFNNVGSFPYYCRMHGAPGGVGMSGVVQVKAGTTITVTNTNDSGDGSLRQAILISNFLPGKDTIAFSIGTGPQTIAPNPHLPEITDPVTIDGSTQPGFAGKPIIEISGVNDVVPAGYHIPPFKITSGNSTIRSLVINRFRESKIELSQGRGNSIEGCYIGPNTSGDTALYGGNGITLLSAYNTIGGTDAGARNVISGNGGFGIVIQGHLAIGNLVQGNFIGTTANGKQALGNRFYTGIYINGASNNTIGGTDAGARNVIADFFHGVYIVGRRNVVQGNFIGTNKAGTAALNNVEFGVVLSKGAINNLIGGTTTGARNILSANKKGGVTIDDGAIRNLVQGNFIGAGATRATMLGNEQSGVLITGGTGNVIGGRSAAAGNLIAYNKAKGINVTNVSGSASNAILRNSIFGNEELGIDLGNDGITPNDDGDSDTGPNNLQNFPDLTTAVAGSGTTTLNGNLNSLPLTDFRIEIFSNPVCDDIPGTEGRTFIGALKVTTDATGNVSFEHIVPRELIVGEGITATATRLDGSGVPVETSEFSACIGVTFIDPSISS